MTDRKVYRAVWVELFANPPTEIVSRWYMTKQEAMQAIFKGSPKRDRILIRTESKPRRDILPGYDGLILTELFHA